MSKQRALPVGIEVLVGDHARLDLKKKLFGALLQYPATDGAILDYREFVKKARAAGTRVVVAHESWPYFARRFGLTVVAALEPTPGVPPSAAYLAALTARMKAAGVRVIIAEPSTSASLVAQVAARAEARVVTLIPSVGGDSEARDYLALFDVDVARLVAALGAAPAAPVSR